MDYFVPAWHGQLIDWSYNVPNIQFDDAISHIRILQQDHRRVGIVITDYQPQLSTKLNQMALNPSEQFSVFDYLQGINTTDSQVVDFHDLNWPEDAIFDFTNFRIFVVSGGQHYATICFDVQGKILYVQYIRGKNAGKTLRFDSRGFVSRTEQGAEETYFDMQGNWRFKHNTQTDEVVINELAPRFCKQAKYDHLNSLVAEVLEERFLNQTLKKSDTLVVTLDNDSLVPLTLYRLFNPVYSASRWHQFDQSLADFDDQPLRVIADSADTEKQVKDATDANVQSTIMPLFESQFKLGHSQRIRQQRIGIFAENMSEDDLRQIIETAYPRLLRDPDDEALYLFAYSQDKAWMVQRVVEAFHNDHKGEFILSRDEIDPGENKIDEEKLPPLLTIKQQRLVSNRDVLTSLDKIRILINWGAPDQFMTMAAISVGIPQLQNFTVEGVEDHRNGIICSNFADLKEALGYYLNGLKHWNESLVYSVQMLNRYSEENLLAQWDKEIESGVKD